MNGYEKMKRLRKMKILKGISAATALSMTVTGLAVAASANPASADGIAAALGGLTKYGIVAESMETYSHFESNFAVKSAKLNNNFNLDSAVDYAARTISFAVTSEESFEQGVEKEHYFGVFSDGERVGEVICVKFTEQGTKEFTIEVPAEYKYSDLMVYELELLTSEDGKMTYATADEGVALYAEAMSRDDLITTFGSCIISDELTAGSEVLSHNKLVYVGSELYGRFKQESDGRWYLGEPAYEQKSVTGEDGIQTYSDVVKLDENGNTVYWYPGAPVANNTSSIVEMPDASWTVDGLISEIQSASDKLASFTSGGGKVTRLAIETDSYIRNEDVQAILKNYEFLRNNPAYVLLVDVTIKPGENTLVFNGGNTWDTNTASRVVFNFHGSGTNPENTHITIGDGFLGTVVAPTARVSNASTFCGAVYAPKVTLNSGESHMATYRSLDQSYNAFFEDKPVETTTEETTPEEVTTVPEETTTEEVTTVSEETTTEETTTVSEEITTEETTTVSEETTTEEVTVEETTVTEPVTESSSEEVTTTPEVTTTTTEETLPPPPEVTTTTTEETLPPPPEVTTTTTVEASSEAVTTAPAEDTTTTDFALIETIPEPVTESSSEEVTTAPEVTTTTTEETLPPPEVTTVEASSEAVTTTPDEDTTTTEFALIETIPEPAETTTVVPPAETTEETTPAPAETTVPEETEVTTEDITVPEETTEVTTTIITIEIEEDTPRGNLITIDEDVPLGDAPPSTGVESSVGLFIAIGCGALAVGIGAQVYSVLLKKKD